MDRTFTYKQNAPAAPKSKVTDNFHLLIANETAGTFNKTKPYKWPSRPNNGSTNTSSEGSTGLFLYKQRMCTK